MEKLAITFVFIITLVAACAGQNVPEEILKLSQHPESVFAVKRLQAKPVSFLSSGAQPDCQSKTVSCRGCDGVNQCAYLGGEYIFMASYDCDEKTPFCDQKTGQCVAKLDSYEQCSFPALARLPNFRCPNSTLFNGYYPAPHSCDQYYVCSDGVAYVYNCPSGYNYDPKTASCSDDSYSSSCTPAFDKCSTATNKNSYVFYDADPAVYAYCDALGSAHMSRCRPNYRIDPNHPEQPCQPFCSAVGRIPNADDPRGYFECYTDSSSSSSSSTSTSTPVEQWCPQGMTFSDAAKRCVS